MLQDRSVALLSQLPLFAGWDPVALQAIVYVNTRLYLGPGDGLTRAGDEAQGAILIIDGVAGAPDIDASAAEFGPGSLIDEMAMFIATGSQSDLVAHSQLEALRISRERMRDVLRNDPRMAAILSERIQARLFAIAERLHAVNSLLGPGEEELLSAADQAPPAQVHDLKDAPNLAPRPRPASTGTLPQAAE